MLSPLLVLGYINVVINSIKKVKTIHYTDTALLIKGSDWNTDLNNTETVIEFKNNVV